MDEIENNDVKRRARDRRKRWVVPVSMAIAASILLSILSLRISGYGEAVLYAATWVVLLHMFIGEYVLLRYLHATSRNQRALDLLGFVLLCGCILSFEHTSLWCAFIAGVMALAVMKYVLIESRETDVILKRYAREKVRWEAPSVILFALLALLLRTLPERVENARIVETAIFVVVAGFAVWMIWIRHIYRWVRDARA